MARHPGWKELKAWEQAGRTPRRRPFSIDAVEFLRPGASWPPYGISLEQAFEAMAGIVAGSREERYVSQLQWGTCGPVQQMSGGSGLSAREPEPVADVDDLRARFHNVWLGRPKSAGVERWKAERDIALDKPVAVPVATYKEYVGLKQIGLACEADIAKTLERLTRGDAGAAMAVALNGCHPRIARRLHHTRPRFTRDGRFAFTLSYGDKRPEDHGSRWDATLARSRPGESFLDTLARARDIHDLLVHGKPYACRSVAADFDALLAEGCLHPGWIERQVAAILDGRRADGDLAPDAFAAVARFETPAAPRATGCFEATRGIAA